MNTQFSVAYFCLPRQVILPGLTPWEMRMLSEAVHFSTSSYCRLCRLWSHAHMSVCLRALRNLHLCAEAVAAAMGDADAAASQCKLVQALFAEGLSCVNHRRRPSSA